MLDRPAAGTIPDTPGSYQFKDAEGRVIYVGKAKSLRQRLSSYFQNPRNLPPRTAQMVAAAASVEWIQVHNEVEALMAICTGFRQHFFQIYYRILKYGSLIFCSAINQDVKTILLVWNPHIKAIAATNIVAAD